MSSETLFKRTKGRSDQADDATREQVRADLSVDDDEGYAFNYEFTGTGNSTYSARPWVSRQYDFYCLDNS